MEKQDPRPPGRPRSTATDDAIAAATLALLRDQGPEAVNVAAVATRSGVARTTIYRRYRDREELLVAALQSVTRQGEPAPELPVGDKLAWLVARTEDVLAGGIGLGGVAAVLAGSDPDLGAALRTALDDGLRPVRDQVRADVDAGRLAASVDPDALLDLVLGAFLAEALRHGTPPRPEWRQRTADLLGALSR
jgi:AcrR family transcriptional regulator